jgi:hypothetical protein
MTSASILGDNRAASASVKNTGVSKPRDATMPETVYGRVPVMVRTSTRSPGRASPATTTSLSFAGAEPAVSGYPVYRAEDQPCPAGSRAGTPASCA